MKTRLALLESTIDGAQNTFKSVAMALAEIKADELYRPQHKTFSDYCAKRYGWAKSYGYNMARAGEVMKSLPDSTIVESESEARELSKVPVEKRAEVIEIAASRAKSEDRPMTAADITQAALPAPDWEAKANERLAARNADAGLKTLDQVASERGRTFPDGYSVLKDRVEREFHKFMDKFEASELPEVRRIIRPWVVRG